MKNVHLIPTDKSSRLYLHSNNELQLRTNIVRSSEDYLGSNQHIYITSDEEIKEDDWLLIIDDFETYVHKHKGDNLPTTYHKKIILTDNQDLIKDGVQAIDDEFLEWFVKNSSCEFAEVELFPKFSNKLYGIIIPKEEPKQETLEEVADKYFPLAEKIGGETYTAYKAFIAGAKWQQGRMYNEEDIIEFAEWIINQDWDETELNFPNNSKSTKELLQLWKEQKPKIVYHE